MYIDKYLPIGSVVMLDGGEKRVMITGYACTSDDEPDVVYDYMGCLFPEGIVSTDENLLFNHDQILVLYHLGLIDEEEEDFMDDLEDMLENGTSTDEETPVETAPVEAAPTETPVEAPQGAPETLGEQNVLGSTKSFFE